ncbi:IS3 family transposase, partial [Tenacibaculum finnmarkense]|uniref:IS3 family transposase n=3 Tax=Tenacibaculum TaxID=104267 RepID=UPI001F1C7AA0
YTYKQVQKVYGIQGRSTVLVWLRKYGTLDWSNPNFHQMPKSKESPAQKIKRLEKELENEKLRNLLLNTMIDVSDKQFGTAIRKKLLSQQSKSSDKNKQVSLSCSCRLLGISRQAVYQGIKRKENRAKVLSQIKPLVLAIRREMPRIGTRKLYYLLKEDLDRLQIKIGRDALFAYLKTEHLLVKPTKNYIKTTHSKHWLRKHPNLLKSIIPKGPEHVYVSDITYIKSRDKTHYLSLVTDAYSRKIMGYKLSDDMGAENVVQAFNMAVKNRNNNNELIHHSDRGLQYCSSIYQKALLKNNVKPSMTDGYDCYQNALAERINGILKQEFLIYKCNNGKELKQLIKESINTYNNKRPHLSLNMKTPNFVHNKKTREVNFSGSI